MSALAAACRACLSQVFISSRCAHAGSGTDLPSYSKVHGGFLVASAIDKYVFIAIHKRFDELGIEYAHVDGSSLYFRGPDGERLELISDPLLEMYGKPVG